MIKLVNWMNNSLPVAWLYLTIGLITFGIGCYFVNNTLYLLKNGEVTQGIVKEVIKSDNAFYPVISYENNEGKVNSFRSRVGCNSSCYSISEEVQILYVAGEDIEPRINNFESLWTGNIFGFLLSISFIGLSIHQIVKLTAKRKRRATKNWGQNT